MAVGVGVAATITLVGVAVAAAAGALVGVAVGAAAATGALVGVAVGAALAQASSKRLNTRTATKLDLNILPTIHLPVSFVSWAYLFQFPLL
ncbi:MAG: hypothetical protein HYU29_08460 [Chloroflexi bacterium]|nr:hypothetical protein [Chloroflexota bacterium]